MTTRYWTGAAGDGSWDTAGNWDSAEPIAGDTAVFNEDGDVAVSAPGTQALTLALLYIGEGYTQDIGTGTGNLLTVNAATKLVHRGKGTLWLDHTLTMPEIIVNASGSLATTALQIDSTTSASITQLAISRGSVNVSSYSGSPIEDLIIGYRSSPPSDVRLTVSSSDFDVDVMHMGGGIVSIDSALATLSAVNIAGGKLTVTDIGAVTALKMTDGLVDWRVAAPAQINAAGLFGGLLDFTQGPAIEKIVGEVQIWKGAEFKYNPDITDVSAGIVEWDGITSV